MYYLWTRITYDVQGEETSATAYSLGPYSSKQVISTVMAYDKWNLGPKTRALYNFQLAKVHKGAGGPIFQRSSNNLSEFVFGGLLEKNTDPQYGKIIVRG